MPADRSSRTEHDDPLVAKLINARQTSFRGQIYPIYLEPLVGSGERWTICLVVVGEDSQNTVINAINSQTATKYLGTFGQGLFNIAAETASNLKEWLKTENISDWIPLFSGTEKGSGRPVTTKNIEAAARIAVKTYAVFMAKTVNEATGKAQDPTVKPSQWEANVKAETCKKYDRLGNMFGQNITIKHRHSEFSYRFGFFGGHIAANFANFNTRDLTYAKSAAESDLMHLEQLRSHNEDQQLIQHNTYELMIYTPIDLQEQRTSADVKRIAASIEGLIAFGDKHEISVVHLHTPQEAAQRIIKQELSVRV